jgi:hypothetical protein
MICVWKPCDGGQICVVCSRRIKIGVYDPHIQAMCRAVETSGPIAVARHCIHRGAEPERYELCRLCGQRDVMAAVYRCDLYGECTSHAHGLADSSGKKLPVCLSCKDFSRIEKP